MHSQVQKRFFELVTDQTALFAPTANPIQTYKELIHYRFKEVIESAYGRFFEHVDEEVFNRLVADFIRSAPKTPLIWQMPNEFRHFLVAHPWAKDYPYLEELLWFEWIEIELFMTSDAQKIEPFEWERHYRCSDSARMRALKYAVFSKAYTQEGDFAIIVYYDFQSHEIAFEEITPFMLEFLEHLKDMTPALALERMALSYEAQPSELKALLQEPLEHYCAKQILISS